MGYFLILIVLYSFMGWFFYQLYYKDVWHPFDYQLLLLIIITQFCVFNFMASSMLPKTPSFRVGVSLFTTFLVTLVTIGYTWRFYKLPVKNFDDYLYIFARWVVAIVWFTLVYLRNV